MMVDGLMVVDDASYTRRLEDGLARVRREVGVSGHLE